MYFPYICFLLGAALVFLTPVLCHVFVIKHRRKVALSGERKLSEVYCAYKWRLGLYIVVFKYRNAKNRTCEADVNVPYDIYIKMSSGVEIPIYVNGNYAYIKMDEIIELCNGIEDTKEFKYIDERPSEKPKKYVDFDEFDTDDDFDEDEDEYDFDDED